MQFNKTAAELRLPAIGQIGYVVYDIGKTRTYYEKTFGIGPWTVYESRPDSAIEKSGPVNINLKVAIAYSGPLQIELIEVMEGRCFYNEMLDHREGFHHLGFFVNNIEKRLAECRERNIQLLHRGQIRRRGITIDYAYLDTAERSLSIIEFIQIRFGPIPVKMNRLAHRISALLGI